MPPGAARTIARVVHRRQTGGLCQRAGIGINKWGNESGSRVGCCAGIDKRVFACTLHRPVGRPFFARKTRKFGSPFVRQHGDIHRRMKPGSGGNRALTHRIHKAKPAQILKNAGASCPRNLPVLHAP